MATATTAPLHRAEPLWRPACRLSPSSIPDKYLPWLLDSASLTERLINHCRGNFRVQLIDQRRARPMRNEAIKLHLRFGCHAVVRQVQLYCGDTPWVYARTIIPPRTLARKFHRFRRLGAQSLGALLFADPSMKRGELEITSLYPGDRLYRLAARDLHAKPEIIWGRRSLFWLSGQPLLVSEFFLPDIAAFTK